MSKVKSEIAEKAPNVPRHAFEVRINIGGETWDYVRRAISEIERYIHEREAETCQIASGGAGGCHSITTVTRDVSPEQYRKELEQWRQNQ